jgi:hypothetical protein
MNAPCPVNKLDSFVSMGTKIRVEDLKQSSPFKNPLLDLHYVFKRPQQLGFMSLSTTKRNISVSLWIDTLKSYGCYQHPVTA